MNLQWSRTMALVVGSMLPLLETWRRWGSGTHWSLWLDDYIAGVLLLWAWRAGRADRKQSRPYLMAAWGYTFALAYGSFFAQYLGRSVGDPSGVDVRAVLAFKAAGMAVAAIGLAGAWRR